MNTNADIVIFNRKLGADRREMYFPTGIKGVSYMENRGSESSESGIRQESLAFRIRIPVDAEVQGNRTYVSEKAYKDMDRESALNHWTLQKGDVIAALYLELAEPVDETEIRNMGEIITIKEYADNTIRGSKEVKHWRIGGV